MLIQGSSEGDISDTEGEFKRLFLIRLRQAQKCFCKFCIRRAVVEILSYLAPHVYCLLKRQLFKSINVQESEKD